MTTSPKPNKRLSLSAITKAFTEHDVADARLLLADKVGALVMLSGKIEKKMKRCQPLKLYIKPNNSKMMVFARFDQVSEAEKVNNSKIRKGSKVSIIGDFATAGYAAVNLVNCRLEVNSGS